MTVRRQQVYGTEAEAFARAEKLTRSYGIWSGVIGLPGGGWLLTFDPPMAATRRGPYAQTGDAEAEL